MLRQLLTFAAIGVLSSCISTGPKRPLTKNEKAVVLEKSSEKISLRLQETCKSIGKVESFNHVDNAKIRAIEVGANTAQILYITGTNGYENYDVRFWKCR